MQVVHDECGEVLSVGCRQRKGVERSAAGFAECLRITLVVNDFLCTYAVVIALSRLESLQSDFVFDVMAYGLSAQQGSCPLQMQGVGAIFHPAVSSSAGLGHDGDTVGCGILEIRPGTEHFCGGYFELQQRKYGTVVGGFRFVHDIGRPLHERGHAWFVDGNVVNAVGGLVGRVGKLFERCHNLEVFAEVLDELGTGFCVPVAGQYNGFVPSFHFLPDDGQ